MTVRQEPEAVSRRWLGRVAAASVIITVAGSALAWGLLGQYTNGKGVARGAARPVADRAEPAHIERGLFRRATGQSEATARAEARLRSRGFLDGQAKIAHLPIERAIELYVALENEPPPRAELGPEVSP